MKVSSTERNGVVIVELVGEIDLVDHEGFANGLQAVSVNNPLAVVLDMKKVAYIASQGIALLIQFAQRIRRNGGQMRMVHIDPRVKTIFDTVNLGAIIPMAPSLDEAVAALQKK